MVDTLQKAFLTYKALLILKQRKAKELGLSPKEIQDTEFTCNDVEIRLHISKWGNVYDPRTLGNYKQCWIDNKWIKLAEDEDPQLILYDAGRKATMAKIYKMNKNPSVQNPQAKLEALEKGE